MGAGGGAIAAGVAAALINLRDRDQSYTEYNKSIKHKKIYNKRVKDDIKDQYDGTLARKLFTVEKFSFNLQDSNADSKVVAINEIGNGVIILDKSKDIVPVFEIAEEGGCNVSHSQYVYDHRDRVQELFDQLKYSLVRVENTMVFYILDAIAEKLAINKDIIVNGNIDFGTIFDAIAVLQNHGLQVSSIIVSPDDYKHLQFLYKAIPYDTSAYFPPGKVLTNKLIYLGLVKKGTAYICAGPEFLGRITPKSELSVVDLGRTEKHLLNFRFFEQVGITSYNAAALQRIVTKI